MRLSLCLCKVSNSHSLNKWIKILDFLPAKIPIALPPSIHTQLVELCANHRQLVDAGDVFGKRRWKEGGGGSMTGCSTLLRQTDLKLPLLAAFFKRHLKSCLIHVVCINTNPMTDMSTQCCAMRFFSLSSAG